MRCCPKYYYKEWTAAAQGKVCSLCMDGSPHSLHQWWRASDPPAPSQWHTQASVLLYAAGIHLKDALGQHQNLALSIPQGRHLYINVLFVPKPLFRGYLLFYCPLFTGRFTADTSACLHNIPSVPLFSEIEYHISRGSTFFYRCRCGWGKRFETAGKRISHITKKGGADLIPALPF